jgi:hypothetical protein
MFKDLLSGLNKFFNRKEFVITVIAVLIAAALLSYTDSKTIIQDGYAEQDNRHYNPQPSAIIAPSSEKSAGTVVPNSESTSYQMKPVANPDSLLPADTASEWENLNPVSNGTTPDLLQAGYHIGLDTIGQTMKNANLQLRADPIIAKTVVSPWLQSTIEPDIGRVPLELGQPVM